MYHCVEIHGRGGGGPASRVHVPVGDVLEGEELLARETLKRPDGGLSSFCLFLSRAQEQLQTPDTGPVGQVEDLNGPFPSSGRRSAFQPLLFRHKRFVVSSTCEPHSVDYSFLK